jgi:hypothetical protein
MKRICSQEKTEGTENTLTTDEPNAAEPQPKGEDTNCTNFLQFFTEGNEEHKEVPAEKLGAER